MVVPMRRLAAGFALLLAFGLGCRVDDRSAGSQTSSGTEESVAQAPRPEPASSPSPVVASPGDSVAVLEAAFRFLVGGALSEVQSGAPVFLSIGPRRDGLGANPPAAVLGGLTDIALSLRPISECQLQSGVPSDRRTGELGLICYAFIREWQSATHALVTVSRYASPTGGWGCWLDVVRTGDTWAVERWSRSWIS